MSRIVAGSSSRASASLNPSATEPQTLWIERFETLDELRAAVRQFASTFNRDWLIERLGYRSPLEVREHLLALVR